MVGASSRIINTKTTRASVEARSLLCHVNREITSLLLWAKSSSSSKSRPYGESDYWPLTPRDLAVLLSYSETRTSRLICRPWTLSALQNGERVSDKEILKYGAFSRLITSCCKLYKVKTWPFILFSDWSTLLNICSSFLSTTLLLIVIEYLTTGFLYSDLLHTESGE